MLDTGGMVISRPPLVLPYGTPLTLTLMSDLHFGASHVDYALIKRELAAAKEHGDRILLNGDIFDMILAKDFKRFSPDVLHPRVRGRRDIVNEAVAWAAEVLGPYAEQIDMVGCGNHETAVESYHNFDPISALIQQLRTSLPSGSKHQIHHGGYTGFVVYMLPRSEGDSGMAFTLWYHHGSGGGAPVTKGMINLHRTGWVDADVIWQGHTHTRITAHIQTLHCPRSGSQPRMRDVRQIITGGYFDTYRGQTQDGIKKHGRRANYAADRGCQPQGKGGARVIVSIRHETINKVERRALGIQVMQ